MRSPLKSTCGLVDVLFSLLFFKSSVAFADVGLQLFSISRLARLYTPQLTCSALHSFVLRASLCSSLFSLKALPSFESVLDVLRILDLLSELP